MSSITLSARLRVATRTAHREAESAPFMRALFAGRIDSDTYALTLRQWHALYSALEEAQERARRHPVMGGFVDRALYRRLALEQDLGWFAGGDTWSAYPVLPATSAYVERLRELVSQDAALLLAHHYVRYLGDLSGGQILRRLIARAYDLPDGQGAAFYAFEGIDAERYKAAYRQRLDDLILDDATVLALIDEANVAFKHNHAVLVELAACSNLEVARYGAGSSASAA